MRDFGRCLRLRGDCSFASIIPTGASRGLVEMQEVQRGGHFQISKVISADVATSVGGEKIARFG
jgi:hypothetical protein